MWSDNLIDGSFRGVPFLYEKVDGEIGRRTILKEYPGRDKPRVEDNGKATRRFTIDMFVIGDDYDADRDALIEALEAKGPGELRHPYWGVMTVSLDGRARVSESTKQGRMAKITATFIEGGDDLRQIFALDTAEVVLTDSAKVLEASQNQFADAFSVIEAIESVASDITSAIQTVTSAISSVRGKISAVLQIVDTASAAITSFSDSVSALILTPVALANTFSAMVTSVVDGVTSIGDAYETVLEFFGSEEALPAEGNLIAERARIDALLVMIGGLGTLADELTAVPSGESQQTSIKRDNQAAFVRLMKASCIASVSTTAVALNYESYDQAQAVREAIVELIDDLISDDDLGDDLYGPLTDLRASLSDHFGSVANELPELEERTALATVPALVLAYQIYGDYAREGEILSRNQQLRDPSAIPSGQAIKVLIDA